MPNPDIYKNLYDNNMNLINNLPKFISGPTIYTIGFKDKHVLYLYQKKRDFSLPSYVETPELVSYMKPSHLFLNKIITRND